MYAKHTEKNLLPYSSIDLFTSKKVAFTLAETLITLGIIGVVAAIILPNLIYKYNEYVTVNKVKAFYSKFSNAVHMFQVDQGCEDDIRDCFPDRTEESLYNSDKYFKGIAKYLNVIESRNPSENIKPKWMPKSSYSIQGVAGDSLFLMSYTSGLNTANHYLLADGTVLVVSINNINVEGSSVIFDINGPKAPNRLGKDQFPIGLGGSKGTKGAALLPENLRNKQFMKQVSPYFSVGSNKGNWSDIGAELGLCSVGWGGNCDSNDISSPTAYVLYHNKLPKFSDFGYPDKP